MRRIGASRSWRQPSRSSARLADPIERDEARRECPPKRTTWLSSRPCSGRSSWGSPGAPARGLGSAFFYLLDQVDFLLGAWLVAWPWVAPTLSRVAWSILFVVVIHQTISSLGALLGMRASAR